jgi:hypothetical protein
MRFETAFNSTAGYLVVDALGHGIDASGWGPIEPAAQPAASLLKLRKLRVVQPPAAGVPVDPRAAAAFELTARLNAAAADLISASETGSGPTPAQLWAWRPPAPSATTTDTTEEA